MENVGYYGHFENHIFGDVDKDICFLNGVLTGFQFVNHKTDGVFDFSLREIKRKDEADLSQTDLDVKDDPRIKQINQDELNSILRKWLFNFVEGENHVQRRRFVTDRWMHFSHSHREDRESFISEYTNCLMNVIGTCRIYKANIMRLGSEDDMVFLETESRRFVLTFSWDS